VTLKAGQMNRSACARAALRLLRCPWGEVAALLTTANMLTASGSGLGECKTPARWPARNTLTSGWESNQRISMISLTW
jgi:hypothetical protein